MKNIEEFHWILASGSPRRKELLEQIGIRPQIIPSGMEEVITSADPELVVMELSEQKAEDVAFSAPEGSIILGADTVVSVDGEILGKPSDHENACEMIRSIQGAFARYVVSIQGNYDTVVGLPVSRVYREWKSLMEQEDEEE